MLPNLFCPGAPKSGTTFLWSLMKHHPDIYLGEAKEPQFFIGDKDKIRREIPQYELTHFDNYRGEKYAGDFSPGYFHHSDPKLLAEILGTHPRFVVCIRSPARRAYSDYFHHLRAHSTADSFPETYQRVPTIRERSFYARSLNRFLDVFPKENFLFLKFENDISNNTQALVGKICAFLGLAPHDWQENPQEHNKTVGDIPAYYFLNEIKAHLPEGQPPIEIACDESKTALSFKDEQIFSINMELSPHTIEFLTRFRQKVTTDFPRATEIEMNRRIFAADIRATQEITGLDLRDYLD